jgi:RNA polymerase sigma-70 factor
MKGSDLQALVDAAARTRPDLDRDAFAAHVEAIGPAGGAIAIADLALAFQAISGDPGAVTEIQAMIDRNVRPALAFAGYSASITDDAIQETSIRLFVGPVEGDGRPLLVGYQGRARLTVWIKTIALRTAARLVEAANRTRGDGAILDQLASSQDPALAVVRAELRPAVRAAFAAAVTGLSYVDRELLASIIIRGETIEQLARRNGVHRATVARWIGRARAALDEGLRRELAAALDISQRDVSSVLSAIASSIELTPARLANSKKPVHR